MFLEVHGLKKSYKKRVVVNNVTLKVSSGEVVGLLGPNGAGKTTTFYMIVGLVKSDDGKVMLNGDDIARYPVYKRSLQGIGYLPQEPSAFRKMTVYDNILTALEIRNVSYIERRARVDRLIKEFNLECVALSFAYSLSGGERRRLELARCLACDPSFVLLDEPFAGVDPIAVKDIQLMIMELKNRGLGVLITDHNVRETLQITDRAYIISQGEVLTSGTPDEITQNAQVREKYLGEEFSL